MNSDRAGASGDGAGLREPRRGQAQSTHSYLNEDDENKTARSDEEVEGQDQERREIRAAPKANHPQDAEKLLEHWVADVAVVRRRGLHCPFFEGERAEATAHQVIICAIGETYFISEKAAS